MTNTVFIKWQRVDPKDIEWFDRMGDPVPHTKINWLSPFDYEKRLSPQRRDRSMG